MNDLFVVAGELACVMCGGKHFLNFGSIRARSRSANSSAFKRRQVQNTRHDTIAFCLSRLSKLALEGFMPSSANRKKSSLLLTKYLLCIIISVALCATEKKLKGVSCLHVFYLRCVLAQTNWH
jgi:hypothetical protein